jgi:hypothetical protein
MNKFIEKVIKFGDLNLLVSFFKKTRDYFLSNNEKNFIQHNKKLFKKSLNTDGVILLELNYAESAVISYSYLTRVLQRKYNAAIVSYFPLIADNSIFVRLLWKLRKLQFRPIKIFQSFGSAETLLPSISKKKEQVAFVIFNEIKKDLKTKSDLESLVVNGVWIGDLIYDSYLNKYRFTTVDLHSKLFLDYLLFMIKNLLYWQDYFKNFDVKAIIVSHTVYFNAIPLRVAIKEGVDAFQANATSMYRLSNANPLAYTGFKLFPEIFERLDSTEKILGLEAAKKKIGARFAGAVGVDMSYSKSSAFGNFKPYRLIRESSKIKILLAPHCFFDSPHPYGLNLFPDVYEWLECIVSVSQKTDYDWYVKTHPDFLPETKKLIEKFFKPHSQFTILPSDSSHRQIKSEGIDFALTIYGTIGFEYAALNIPVINASVNSPHIAYDFNINPSNKAEYKKILMNLSGIDHRININQVYEYYYMKNLYRNNNLFFNDYDAMIKKMGGYKKQFSPKVYKYWIDEWSIEKHKSIIQLLEEFVESGEYFAH